MLNLGCGITVYNGEPEKWVNLDIDSSVFGRVRKEYDDKGNLLPSSRTGHNIVADAHYLPFKRFSFGLTLCTEVLEHVKDPVKVLKEIRRVSTYMKVGVPDGLLKCLMRIMNFQWPFISDHVRYYTKSLLKKQLHAANWQICSFWKEGSISVKGKRYRFPNHFVAACCWSWKNTEHYQLETMELYETIGRTLEKAIRRGVTNEM